ncbi:hypothetical protein P3S68_021139 [Capsicum galapagoense]
MSRKGVYMTCRICHGQNHNKRGCPFKDSVGSSILNVGPSDVPSTSRPRGGQEILLLLLLMHLLDLGEGQEK